MFYLTFLKRTQRNEAQIIEISMEGALVTLLPSALEGLMLNFHKSSHLEETAVACLKRSAYNKFVLYMQPNITIEKGCTEAGILLLPIFRSAHLACLMCNLCVQHDGSLIAEVFSYNVEQSCILNNTYF